MSERNKKYLIVVLLLLACILSGFLLVHSSGMTIRNLSSFSEADSLLKNDLELFNISQDQVHERIIRLDSVNQRKEYFVDVPPGFSKTHLHQQIRHTFYPYNVETPTKVVFPEKDFIIHLLYNENVFSSIFLRTDPDLVLRQNFASIMVAFRKAPSKEMLDLIESFGDPIPLVFMVQNPEEAKAIREQVEERYSDIMFWVRESETTGTVPAKESSSYPRLQLLQQLMPDAEVLSFHELETEIKGDDKNKSLSFVDVSEAILLHESVGKSTFTNELNKFRLKARRGEHPIAIVMAEEESLNWLQSQLADFKKSGLQIIPPAKSN